MFLRIQVLEFRDVLRGVTREGMEGGEGRLLVGSWFGRGGGWQNGHEVGGEGRRSLRW